MIVVTCDCTQTYRLPDRYAGKRCRCRECGERISVPAASEECPTKRSKRSREERKAARARRRARRAKATVTRRLGPPQNQEILADGAELRRTLGSQRVRVSESLHQLAPLHSESREPASRGRSAEEERRRADAKKAKKAAAKKAEAKKAKKAKKAEAKKAEAKKAKKAKKAEAKKAKAKKDKKAKAKKADAKKPESEQAKGAKRTVAAPARRRRGRGGLAPAHLARTVDLTELTRRPRRPRRKRHLGSSSGDRPAPELPATRTWGPAAAVAAILGLLFLGVGLVVGGAFGADALVRSVSTDLERLEQATRDGQWDVAAAQAKALEGRLAGSSDAASLARLSEARAGIDAMLVYRAIPVSDPEARFDEAMELAQDSHPAVRAGIALELRSFGDLDAAVECLVELSEDPDPRVVEAATRSIVHAGGPLAAPFLERTILATVPGDALGDVAVEQALRLEEPEATPALLAILKTRPDAKAPLLARTLRLLAEVGDGRACVEAAERFENHPAFDVKRAAEAVLDTLG